jgi:H+/Cl- antiporter ClcA
MEVVLKLSGILLGVLARTLVPYLRKVKQGKVKEFKNEYWLSALAAFILGLITTLLIFPKLEIAQTGLAWNSLVNETAKWAEKKGGAR